MTEATTVLCRDMTELSSFVMSLGHQGYRIITVITKDDLHTIVAQKDAPAKQEHCNNLTPEEAERLAMLAEECGEVIQVIGKILRHGYESHHPDTPNVSNRQLLNNELRDIATIQRVMERRGDIKDFSVNDLVDNWDRKLRFTHHQYRDNT